MKITIEGPRGSGKTTLVEALNKLIRTQAGEFSGIRVNFKPEQQFELHKEEGDREVWIIGEPIPVLPAVVPLVPLGKNVTRDGREARVICIDARHGGKPDRPVIALVKSGDLEEEADTWRADGSYERRGGPSNQDLVGHLPPEPPKPREFWVCEGPTSEDEPRVYTVEQTGLCKDIRQVHVREVTTP